MEVTDWTGKALFLFDTGSEGGEKYDVADSFGGEGLDLRPGKEIIRDHRRSYLR